MMKRGFLIPAVLALVSVFLFAGCFGVEGNFKNIRNDLLSAAGTRFHTDIEFSLGKFGLGIAKEIVRHENNDEDAKEILKHISKVQIGVYKNRSRTMPEFKDSFIRKADKEMERHGWESIVKNYGERELNIVYVQNDNSGRLSEIFVINMDRKELTLVEVSGNLDEVITYIIKEKGLGFQYASARYR